MNQCLWRPDRTTAPKRLRPLLVVGLVVFLAACSSTTFVYNRLDFIVPWYLDDYAELDGEQEEYLDEQLGPFLKWHRSHELPQYLAMLNQMEAGLDQPLTEEGVEQVALEFEQAWLRLEDEALTWLLGLGAQLTDAQIAGFMAELWDKQKELEEKYLERSDEEFYEDSYESFVDNASDWLGRLSPEQKALIRESTDQLKRSDSAWLMERERWLNQLGVLLEREPGWEQRVRDAIAARNDNVSPEYMAIYEHNGKVLVGAMTTLVNERTERQDRHLRKEIAGLRSDLQVLIAQGETTPTDGCC